MSGSTTDNRLRDNLVAILDDVVDKQEIVIVRRNRSRDVALIPASELAALMETAHLLRSPRNSRRLLASLHRAQKGKTQPSTLMTMKTLS